LDFAWEEVPLKSIALVCFDFRLTPCWRLPSRDIMAHREECGAKAPGRHVRRMHDMALSMPQGCHTRVSQVRLAPDVLLLPDLVRKVDGMTGHQLWSICTDDEQNILISISQQARVEAVIYNGSDPDPTKWRQSHRTSRVTITMRIKIHAARWPAPYY
jgi:hypothetical protein